MSLFEHLDFDDHEQVVHCCDRAVGLTAIIAIHNTRLGPSLGGCRMYPYAREADALTDVLRLSRGMTFKNAMAGLPLGGGKSVIIGNPKRDKTPALLRRFGEVVNALSGRYIAAEDVGVRLEDIQEMATKTNYVSGLKAVRGVGGDPAPFTARGVFEGLKVTVSHRLQTDSLQGVRVAVQGLGRVGRLLCTHLKDAGADLVVADLDSDAITWAADVLGATVAPANMIMRADVDVLAPCAMGGVLRREMIELIRATVIAGAANNQLAAANCGSFLKDRNILYAPDYVINAGGMISAASEYIGGGTREQIDADILAIGTRLRDIYQSSDASGESTQLVADRLVQEKLAA